ncbi:MAG: hypothetical protein K2W82_15250 [Candidatus Obscuribacterales bacterium]|nr:hypothetical protein [Candidatus Obscuribacterales bacterium]
MIKPNLTNKLIEPESYIVDNRPLCEGMPFVLTDAAHPRIVLKQGSHFLVMDEMAQIPACNTLGYGYYRHDTRQISEWELSLNGAPLALLSADVQKGYSGTFLYTNLQSGDIPQQKITIERQIVLDDLLWENIAIENFGSQPYDIDLQMKFHSDFADMFEVRGLNRSQRGARMIPLCSLDRSGLFLAYRGLDGVLVETVMEFFGAKPDQINDGIATFKLHLPVRTVVELELCVVTKLGGQPVGSSEAGIMSFRDAKQASNERYELWRSQIASIDTEHELVDLSIQRSFDDFYILRQPTPKGWGLAAGLPWYSTVFGRDSAIAGLQVVPFMPELAKETIEVLAAYQGQAFDAFTEEHEGKIMHEIRLGELSRVKQIPHTPYYGTVDATQLWLLLFCEYIKWTGDLDFATKYWPAVKLALAYLDRACEAGNGYLRYQATQPHQLENQGWKDSGDSIMYADGRLAEAPIAVCEAQAYHYAARNELAGVAALLGHKAMARKLLEEAFQIKNRFEKDFWLVNDNYVALALDGQDRQVGAISSNPGHCLWTGILDPDKAQLVADRIMSQELHSGWGIRTLSANAAAYNPISYHNGSVWPHDNAIIGEGMRKIGRLEDMKKIMLGIVEVSLYNQEYRLPELFCGFQRLGVQRPVDYPVSCSPQAWAAGSLFQLIKSCLNFKPDAINKSLQIVDPSLPEWLGKVTIKGLRVGRAMIDLSFDTQDGSTYGKVLNKQGQVKVIIEN